MTNGNGLHPELPPTREAIIEQGMRIQQETAAERDTLRRELQQSQADIAGFKIALEAQAAQLADADSRVEEMRLQRDQAVADRAVYEVLFISFKSQLRAFAIPNAPLIRDKADISHITGDGDHETDPYDRDDVGHPYRRDIG